MIQQTVFCGLDVAKDTFVVSIKGNGFLLKNRTFKMDSNGFHELDHLLKDFRPNLLIGMEPTGIYHNNLLNFLRKLQYNSVILNPYMLHQFFKFTNNKPTKTDAKDSKNIADFLELKKEEFKDAQRTPDQRGSLRYLVREKEKITQEIARTKTEIRRILALLFPELERTAGIFTKNILAILLTFGGAARIRTIPKENFITKADSLTQDKSPGRKSALTPEKIYELASTSIAFEYPDYEEILKMKIKKLYTLLEDKDNITNLIDKRSKENFKREIEILCSIPGIGKECAQYFMAEIIDIKRFPHYRNLVGFCGLDPVIKQSGRFKGGFKISKRGNAHARRIIWIMAGSVKRNCAPFRDYYLKKRAEGKSYKEAVIATSTKLLRCIYALLSQNRCFM